MSSTHVFVLDKSVWPLLLNSTLLLQEQEQYCLNLNRLALFVFYSAKVDIYCDTNGCYMVAVPPYNNCLYHNIYHVICLAKKLLFGK